MAVVTAGSTGNKKPPMPDTFVWQKKEWKIVLGCLFVLVLARGFVMLNPGVLFFITGDVFATSKTSNDIENVVTELCEPEIKLLCDSCNYVRDPCLMSLGNPLRALFRPHWNPARALHGYCDLTKSLDLHSILPDSEEEEKEILDSGDAGGVVGVATKISEEYIVEKTAILAFHELRAYHDMMLINNKFPQDSVQMNIFTVSPQAQKPSDLLHKLNENKWNESKKAITITLNLLIQLWLDPRFRNGGRLTSITSKEIRNTLANFFPRTMNITSVKESIDTLDTTTDRGRNLANHIIYDYLLAETIYETNNDPHIPFSLLKSADELRQQKGNHYRPCGNSYSLNKDLWSRFEPCLEKAVSYGEIFTAQCAVAMNQVPSKYEELEQFSILGDLGSHFFWYLVLINSIAIVGVSYSLKRHRNTLAKRKRHLQQALADPVLQKGYISRRREELKDMRRRKRASGSEDPLLVKTHQGENVCNSPGNEDSERLEEEVDDEVLLQQCMDTVNDSDEEYLAIARFRKHVREYRKRLYYQIVADVVIAIVISHYHTISFIIFLDVAMIPTTFLLVSYFLSWDKIQHVEGTTSSPDR